MLAPKITAHTPMPKIRYFDRYKYPNKLFLNFKGGIVVLFGFSTGYRGEFRIFEE
jgi:hypothetical protein